MDHIEIKTTVDGREEAERIASALLERRLAACVQIGGPIESRYWWRDEAGNEAIEVDSEFVCTIKTRRELFEQVAGAIRELHPYEVPEIVAVPLVTGSQDYLAWIDATVRT